ncbi:MBL fold metallo-hydrolase [Burkholderia contaminans]|nr:MBL fold metallo-hydrolase [Burkholderia contaminans]
MINAMRIIAKSLVSGLAFRSAYVSLDTERIGNPYSVPGDDGRRASFGYFVRRAWAEITRGATKSAFPHSIDLNLDDLRQRNFAVAWLGHAALLIRADSKWVLVDPMLSTYAGPLHGFGPKRLAPLPLELNELPHIDIVLISHDHYDHLDLPTMKYLAGQVGGAPRFLVGQGLRQWFAEKVKVEADEFDWWDSQVLGQLRLTFVPAQHSSGRGIRMRNTTRWGGWVMEHARRRFYFPGDTSYVPELFADIRARVGAIDLAALPIGAYLPRYLMKHEHMSPDDAVRAHLDLGAARSFGVHWGTFQLGDEDLTQPADDLARVTREEHVENFDVLRIGSIVDVGIETPTEICAHADICTRA